MKSFLKNFGVWSLIGMAMFLGISFWSIIYNGYLVGSGENNSSGPFAELFATATTTSITATVTAQHVSLTVSPTSVAYGTLVLSTTKSTTSGELNNTFTITNDGNVTENITGISLDATGGTTWQLAGTAASDAYTHKFSNSGTAPYTWTDFNADNTTYTDIKTGLTASATTPMDLKIGTPTTTTDYNQKSITVTIQAAAQ